MTKKFPNLCSGCFFYIPDDGSCKAFPRGIPDEILRLGGDHRTTVGGDRGIVFQQKQTERARAAVEEWERFNQELVA